MSWIIQDLQREIRKNRKRLAELAESSPVRAYSELSRIASEIGRIHRVQILINFTSSSQASDSERYGSRNVSIIIDNSRKKFLHHQQEDIRAKVSQLFPEAIVKSAFGYEGRDGLKIHLATGRIDVLAGAVHFWCELSQEALALLDWLFREEYDKRPSPPRTW